MPSMDIDIGARVIIEFSNKQRLTAHFAGLSRDEFVLLRVPMTAGIREQLDEGVYLQFRYLKDGKIISFGAEILRFQASPSSVVFISYPIEFSEYNLRREGRVECRFPAVIAVSKTSYTGHFVDISAKGGKFIFEGEGAPEVKEKTSVSGTFTTMEVNREYTFTGVIMEREPEGTERVVGIKFEEEIELPEGVRERLKQIEDVAQAMEATKVS